MTQLSEAGRNGMQLRRHPSLDVNQVVGVTVASPKARRRGVGSITSYETKAGVRWRWQLHVPIDETDDRAGTRLVGQAGFRTARAADDALQSARRRLRESLDATRRQNPTVTSYSEQWLDGLRLANSTLYGYRRIVRLYITPHIGPIHLERVTATRLAKLYVELERNGGNNGRPLSANTVNKTHVVLGAMLDAAVDDGIIPANPARKSRVVKAPSGRAIRESAPEITTWSAEQLRSFLDWDRNEYDDDMFALWHTIAHTGMRRSEALALRWADVDLKQQRVSVRRAIDTVVARTTKRTKTGNARAIDIDDETTTVLRDWKSLRGVIAFNFARSDAYVFGNLHGDLVRPNSITAKWDIRLKAAQRVLGAAAIPHMTIHGLRHTHATLLLQLGVHPKVVQERLGHSTISTTLNIYSHVTPTMQRDAVTRLANLLR